MRFKKGVFSFLLLSLCMLFLFSSCARPYERAQGYAMGAFVSVSAERKETARELVALVSALENEISHAVPSSSIAALNRGESVPLSDTLFSVLSLCLEIEAKTEGAFSILLLPVTSLWDFNEGTVPSSEALSLALGEVEASSLSLKDGEASLSGGGIDLGAVGKGMGADVLANALKQKGESGIVAVGGSLGAVGNKNGEGWLIGVRDPFSSSQSATIGTLCIEDAFVSTSGSYEKAFTAQGISYHHILSKKTGLPVENDLVSVTVIAKNGALSDILSTALYAVGVEKGASLCAEYGAEALFVKKDGEMLATAGFASLFSASEGEVHILE